MNKELLLKTAAYIREHPEDHNQSWWFTASEEWEKEHGSEGPYYSVSPEKALMHGLSLGCGTTACAAGVMVMLSGLKVEDLQNDQERTSWRFLAQRLMDLPDGDIESWLFGFNEDEKIPDILEAIVEGATYFQLLEWFDPSYEEEL